MAGRVHRQCGTRDLGMGDDGSELCRYRNEERLFGVTKAAGIGLLNHQHTQQVALVDNGRPHKSIEAFLTQPRHQLKAWVGHGVVEVQHFTPACHPADQTLINAQGKCAYFVLIQALSGPEHQTLTASVSQINRADLGLHRRSDLMDNQFEGLCQIIGVVDRLHYFAQHLDHDRLPGFSCPTPVRAGSSSAKACR